MKGEADCGGSELSMTVGRERSDAISDIELQVQRETGGRVFVGRVQGEVCKIVAIDISGVD